MILRSIRHDWPEKAGFLISRPVGHKEYTFLHFLTPIELRIGEETIHIPPGSCILYAPGTPQWFHSNQDVIHNWMHFGPEAAPLLAQFHIPEDKLLQPGETGFISELFRKIEAEFFSDHPHREALIQSYFMEFLIRLSRALDSAGPESQIPRHSREKLRLVRRQILSQPEKKWNVAQMAQLAALSPSRFHAVYKRIYGTSPLQDVIEARIRYAQTLLQADGTLTLPEVAERLGYHDQYHFIRQFKAVTGVTPGVYRKNHG